MAKPTSYLPTDFFGWLRMRNISSLLPAASTLDFLLACERAVSGEHADECVVLDTGRRMYRTGGGVDVVVDQGGWMMDADGSHLLLSGLLIASIALWCYVVSPTYSRRSRLRMSQMVACG